MSNPDQVRPPFGWWECGGCGQLIPLTSMVVVRCEGVPSVEPDMTDVAVHTWTHELGDWECE